VLAKEWEMLTEDAGMKITGRQETGRGIIWLPTCQGPSVRPDGPGNGIRRACKIEWCDKNELDRQRVRMASWNSGSDTEYYFYSSKGGIVIMISVDEQTEAEPKKDIRSD
jgi:hypothetical protein